MILTGISIQQFHPKKNNSKSFQGIGEFTENLFVSYLGLENSLTFSLVFIHMQHAES